MSDVKMSDVNAVGRRFAVLHRGRRDRASSDRLLSLWCAWEQTRDSFARDVAEDVVHGYTASVAVDAERYRIAAERVHMAQRRYSAAWRAKRDASNGRATSH